MLTIHYNKSTLQKGFTLIELLIVIAVLGVLATAVLAVLNPVEQLARGRDAGRQSSVTDLGHAMQNYYVAQGAYPTANTTWQNSLVTSKDISVVISTPANSIDCTAANNSQNGYCFVISGTDFVIWTLAESATARTKAGPLSTSCAATSFPAYVYSSALGKGGVACLAAANSSAVGATLY